MNPPQAGALPRAWHCTVTGRPVDPYPSFARSDGQFHLPQKTDPHTDTDPFPAPHYRPVARAQWCQACTQ